MTRSTPRRSRRQRRCDGCKQQIHPGDRYMEHVVSPNDPDVGNGTWWRMAECEPCILRYGREMKAS